MKQYSKCGSCRALGTKPNTGGYKYCELGYEINQGRAVGGIIVDAIPKEPCPKPLTVSAYVQSLKDHK